MKKFLLPIIILLTIISCGKKREVIAYGTESWPQDGLEFSTEFYLEHDSAFNAWTDKKTGKLFYIEKAASLQELKDSTYTRIFYYSSSGKMHTIDHVRNKKREGEALSFYESGKKKSRTSFSNGRIGNYESWYESGELMIQGELLPDSTFRHREYFENGLPKKEMATDKNGKGQATYYYANGKIHETGPIVNFNRTGIWKIYDTLGNVKQDTLFGIK